jgi:shikimate dehydrogenase
VISASTRVAAIIGDPVRHSLSPILHNAAFQELGLDWVYVAFEVPKGGAAAALAAMRTLRLAGLSVTMPHKTAAVDACDEVSAAAAQLQSVNTVTPIAGGRLRGDSTDGEGFLRSVTTELDVNGASVVILGAGGAARAVAYALHHAGAQVQISARREERAATAVERVGGGAVVAWDQRNDAAHAADLVVNATPIGMPDNDGNPLLPIALRADQVVADLVYHPIDTELLHEARSRGARTVDGLQMLVHQAALQFEQWTGQPAPVDTMHLAVRRAIG